MPAQLRPDAYGNPIQITGPLAAAQELAIGAASVQSAAFALDTPAILLSATSDCRILIGTAPVAIATSTLLKAADGQLLLKLPQPIGNVPWKIAVIQETAAGKLSVTEVG